MAPVSNHIPQSQLLNHSFIFHMYQPARAQIYTQIDPQHLTNLSKRQNYPRRNSHYIGFLVSSGTVTLWTTDGTLTSPRARPHLPVHPTHTLHRGTNRREMGTLKAMCPSPRASRWQTQDPTLAEGQERTHTTRPG